MREIGSEFWTDCTPLNGNGLSSVVPDGYDSHDVLSGRTALDIILDDIVNTKTVTSAYLPSYCCHTMIEPFLVHNISVQFYEVSFGSDGIVSDIDIDHPCDIVYLIDYFGYINNRTHQLASEFKARGKSVIYDATHSLFCRGYDNSNYDYVFASFRKWTNINAAFCAKRGEWDNFLMLSEFDAYTDLRNASFDRKKDYVCGDEKADKDLFLRDFACAEEMLEKNYKRYKPDKRSFEALNGTDVDFLKNARRENAEYLTKMINGMDCKYLRAVYTHISENDSPLFVPLEVTDGKRDALRRHLIDNRIYLPVHWPVSELHREYKAVGNIYETTLSCVCDQRYSISDMTRIIDVIKQFVSNND